MNKETLENIFKKLNITYNEGIQNMESNDTLPRLVFFDYVWDPITASGENYNTVVTYQISFFSLMPRDPLLIDLKNKLSEFQINPIIYHEYLKEKREFHSYFSIEISENLK